MSDDTPKFSVLMAIYIKDSPLFLSEALQSIYKNTVAPDEVIIIRDMESGAQERVPIAKAVSEIKKRLKK